MAKIIVTGANRDMVLQFFNIKSEISFDRGRLADHVRKEKVKEITDEISAVVKKYFPEAKVEVIE